MSNVEGKSGRFYFSLIHLYFKKPRAGRVRVCTTLPCPGPCWRRAHGNRRDHTGQASAPGGASARRSRSWYTQANGTWPFWCTAQTSPSAIFIFFQLLPDPVPVEWRPLSPRNSSACWGPLHLPRQRGLRHRRVDSGRCAPGETTRKRSSFGLKKSLLLGNDTARPEKPPAPRPSRARPGRSPRLHPMSPLPIGGFGNAALRLPISVPRPLLSDRCRPRWPPGRGEGHGGWVAGRGRGAHRPGRTPLPGRGARGLLLRRSQRPEPAVGELSSAAVAAPPAPGEG